MFAACRTDSPAWVYERNKDRPPHAPFIDDWGGGQIEIEPDVWYPGVHPMAKATTLEEIHAYPWPDMDDPTRVAHLRAEARRLREDNEYAILGAPWLLFLSSGLRRCRVWKHFS